MNKLRMIVRRAVQARVASLTLAACACLAARPAGAPAQPTNREPAVRPASANPASRPTGDAQAASTQAAHPPDVRGLIADLGSPNWRAREAATNALMDRGPVVYPLLRDAFRRTGQYEVRRRVRDVARELFMTERVGPAIGFLGISYMPVTHLEDPRLPPDVAGVRITRVIDYTAAFDAGIRKGDVIVCVDDEYAADADAVRDRLVSRIGARRPGTSCAFGIIRGGRGFSVDHTALDDAAAGALAAARVIRIDHDDHVVIRPQGAALRLAGSVRLSGDYELETGDVLIGLNHEPIPTESADRALADWAAGTPPIARRARGRSLEWIRGVDSMTAVVVLGRPPIGITPDRTPVQRGSAEQLAEAEAEFRTWWRDTFDPDGLLTDGPSGGVGSLRRLDSRRP